MSFSIQTNDTIAHSVICISDDGDVLANYTIKGAQTDPKEALNHAATMLSGMNGRWVLAPVNGSIAERKARGAS